MGSLCVCGGGGGQGSRAGQLEAQEQMLSTKVSLPGVPLYFPFFVMDYLICPVLRKQKLALGGRRFESSHYKGCRPLRTSGRRGSWLHSVLAPVGT